MADGRLIVEGRLTRTGVFTYRNPDGSVRREYRPPEEVFNQDSLKTFAFTPVTDNHPPELVTSENAKQYTVGTVGETVRRDEDHVTAALVVFDADTIAKMEAGKVQLSCGYQADIIDQAGETPTGERYDAIQRNIRGNHVALVDVGRAGPEARVRMDAAFMLTGDHTEDKMDELKKALEEAAREKARADAAEKERDEQKTRADKLETELATAHNQNAEQKARIDELETTRKDALDNLPKLVQKRVDLETKAVRVLGERKDGEPAINAMPDRDLMVEVVKRIDGTDIDKERSMDYVTARFDSAIERAFKADSALGEVRSFIEDNRRDAANTSDPEEAARQKMIEDNRNAYKGTSQEAK